MPTGDWLTLNLWQEGQPDFLHEAPLASSCGAIFAKLTLYLFDLEHFVFNRDSFQS